MEEFNRRLGKSRKNKKQPKRDIKSRRQKKKSDDKLFATLDKHRKSNNLIHKITTERLTVRPGLFENAIRSDTIHKEDQAVYMQDDAKAVLNEDLFQYLDNTNRNNNTNKRLKRNIRKIKPDLINFGRSNDEVNKVSVVKGTTKQKSDDYGSLFRTIQEQYNNVSIGDRNFDKENEICELDNLGLDLERLHKLVYESLYGTDISPQNQYLQDIIDKICQISPEKYLVYRMLHAQKNFDKEQAYSTDGDDYDGPQLLRPTDPSSVPPQFPPLENLRMAEDAVAQIEMDRCRTPDNQAIVFPDESYRTPENQKYKLQEPPPSSSKYEPGIYVVPPDYRSTIRDDCLLKNQLNVKFNDDGTHSNGQPTLYHMNSNDKFTFNPHPKEPVDLGITRIEKRHVTDGKLKDSNLFIGESNVLERPPKLFKFDFDRENNYENTVPDFLNEHHSFVHSRPKKMFICENNFTSPIEDNHVKILDPRRKLDYDIHCPDSSQLMDYMNIEPIPPVQSHRQQKAKQPAATAVQDFIKPKYAPQDFVNMQYPNTMQDRVPLRPRFSPNELNLRKKYAPHTLRVEELNDPSPNADTNGYFMDLDLGVNTIPKCTDTPDVPFKPRFHM